MAIRDIAAAHQRRQAEIARNAAAAVDRLWVQVDTGGIVGSWAELEPQALAIVGSAQGIAAASSGAYVAEVASAQGLAGAPAGRVQSRAFAFIASDGRPLSSLLTRPAISALSAIRRGASTALAMALGRTRLGMIVRTQIADAGRGADGVSIAARRQVTGYIRMTVGATCSRCLILAGKRFAWNAGFARHPCCDCRHVPIGDHVPGDVRTDPRASFRAMSPQEQDRIFTRAGAQAIRDGADMNQIVNARRGMATAGESRTRLNAEGRVVNERHRTRVGATTSESTGRRGVSSRGRLMPETIYARAGDDRDKALELLTKYGYLI